MLMGGRGQMLKNVKWLIFNLIFVFFEILF